MTSTESQKALAWTEQFLCFSQDLNKDQLREWLRAALDYTPEDWAEGIRKYYRVMKTDFRPPLGKVLVHMPPKEVKARECPLKGFKEDPELDFNENMKMYMKFKGYGNAKAFPTNSEEVK